MKRRFRPPVILAAVAVLVGLGGASPAAAELVCDTETGGTQFYPGGGRHFGNAVRSPTSPPVRW